ncbi:MAG: hypothetical protein R3Y43_01045 [Alphaproteobacteria bacterium]
MKNLTKESAIAFFSRKTGLSIETISSATFAANSLNSGYIFECIRELEVIAGRVVLASDKENILHNIQEGITLADVVDFLVAEKVTTALSKTVFVKAPKLKEVKEEGFRIVAIAAIEKGLGIDDFESNSAKLLSEVSDELDLMLWEQDLLSVEAILMSKYPHFDLIDILEVAAQENATLQTLLDYAEKRYKECCK